MIEPSGRSASKQKQPGERHGSGGDQSNDQNSQEPPHSNYTTQKPPPYSGLDHSIRPGVPVPETVLVAVMTDGSYLLMAYPQREPVALVAQDNAGLLHEALTAAFHSPVDEDSSGSPTDETARTNSTSAGTVLPESGAMDTEQSWQ